MHAVDADPTEFPAAMLTDERLGVNALTARCSVALWTLFPSGARGMKYEKVDRDTDSPDSCQEPRSTSLVA